MLKSRCLAVIRYMFLLAAGVGLSGFLPASAHEPHAEGPATFSIVGKGVVTAEPDIAYISAGVVSEAKEATEALSENTKKMTEIFETLEKAGIEKQHIQTSNFSLRPNYGRNRSKSLSENPTRQIVGYTATNTVTVRVNELEKVGTVLSEVVKLGSNQLGNIRFDLSNKKELLDKARMDAVADAQRKAETMVEAAGVELGRILSISEGGVRPPQRFAVRGAAFQTADAEAVPIAGGEQSLSITVSITWEIEQGD